MGSGWYRGFLGCCKRGLLSTIVVIRIRTIARIATDMLIIDTDSNSSNGTVNDI